MKYPIIIAVVLSACTKPEPVPLRFWYATVSREFASGVDSVVELRRHDPRDERMRTVKFELDGVQHYVTAYNSENYAPVDGGVYTLELDSMGAILYRSTTWPGFTVARSNNDSINDLIFFALAAANRSGMVENDLPPPPRLKTR